MVAYTVSAFKDVTAYAVTSVESYEVESRPLNPYTVEIVESYSVDSKPVTPYGVTLDSNED